jgi:importin-9
MMNQAAAAAAGGSPNDANLTIDDDDDDDDGDNGSDDDADWEDDETNVLDLGLGSTKAELMAFVDEDDKSNSAWASRQRDDETQVYLTQWFRNAATERAEEFANMFTMLSASEQTKLKRLVGG